MFTFLVSRIGWLNSPVTRAERAYQQRSVKPPRTWRRWVYRILKWSMITMALILFGGLLSGSLLWRDPQPIVEKLTPLPTLLVVLTFIYHVLLMFQTISLAANSVSREKEAQTWDVLVLTGFPAHQIVCSKWWATVQHQLPSYLLLAALRIGATAGIGISMAPWATSNVLNGGYTYVLMLPHPVILVLAIVVITAFTLVNLAFSAACGVMASTASRSVVAVARGFSNQILLSLIPGITLAYLFWRSINYSYSSIYNIMFGIGVSLADNGITVTAIAFAASKNLIYFTDKFDSPIKPFSPDWIIAAAISLLLYSLLIWYALWRAEQNAIAAMATPYNA